MTVVAQGSGLLTLRGVTSLGKCANKKRPEPYGLTMEGWADNMRDMIAEFEKHKKRMKKPK